MPVSIPRSPRVRKLEQSAEGSSISDVHRATDELGTILEVRILKGLVQFNQLAELVIDVLPPSVSGHSYLTSPEDRAFQLSVRQSPVVTHGRI